MRHFPLLRRLLNYVTIRKQSTMKDYVCNYEDVISARARIRDYVHNTPLMTSQTLNKISGHNIFLKTENFQKTGSFKIRGAMNAVFKIKQDSPEISCVVTHSSGNHGQALASAAQQADMECHVVMPKTSPQCKIDAVKGYGANVILCEASEKARQNGAADAVSKYNGIYLSSSQAREIIAGQGTISLEILEKNPDIDVIIAAVGGGGLLSGIAIAAKKIKPNIKIIAAEPELANDCYISKKLGVLTPNPVFPRTIADGVKVSIGPSTWPIIRDVVDDVITVTDDEIAAATLLVWERCKLVIETSAGLPVAVALSEKFRNKVLELCGNGRPKNIAVVLCGGNLDLATVPQLMTFGN